MKILQALPVLIVPCLLLIASEKKSAYTYGCTIRCGQLNNLSAERGELVNNIAKQSLNIIDEKDIPFFFIPSYFKYYEATSRHRNCKGR